ncbi:carbonic anhydrase 15-like isoform X3 [Echinops telfairi]|uniref:Carbonic anhydrase 15-like isoform X3 n=1 Tax=Echinops telfairi TaxID=9371 RepID=A0AC55D1F2_ECHTE|nr:carbonic anhydrase 15-like isoform X3 [Echinops telfairi]
MPWDSLRPYPAALPFVTGAPWPCHSPVLRASLATTTTMLAAGFTLTLLMVLPGTRADLEGAWCYDSQDPTCVLLRVDTGQQSRLEIHGGGLPPSVYRARQVHFHWGAPAYAGSEHSLDGQRYAMEMHVLHVNSRFRSMREALGHPDGLAVLAVLLTEQDTDNPSFSVLVSGLKNVSARGLSTELASTFSLASLLPASSSLGRYYRYSGSLTTPGCQPAVLWTVFQDTVPIGRAQVAQFQTLLAAGPPGSGPTPLADNFRPQQPLGSRRVTASPGALVRAAAPRLGLDGALAALLTLWIGRQLGQGV